jgi:hypothetical protein
MKVTRDVITDLLPLYFAQEASTDTRALVEGFLQQDPEFARLAKERPDRFLPNEIPSTLNPEDEMATLERTKRLLKVRSTLLGCAIFFTLFPFAFTFDSSGLQWLVWSKNPTEAVVVLGIAGLLWVGYSAMKRRLRATGL